MTLGAKGVIEVELVSSGEKWGRGPRQDIHSSNKARVDSPAWHLVRALATLVSADGNDPAIAHFADKARPLAPEEKAMIAAAARRMDENAAKQLLGVERWVRDVPALRDRPDPAAAQCGLLARLRVHRGAAAPCGRPLRARTRQRGACTG